MKRVYPPNKEVMEKQTNVFGLRLLGCQHKFLCLRHTDDMSCASELVVEI